MTNEKKESTFMMAYRALVGLASLTSPFILYFVVAIFTKLDSHGNRLTGLEQRQIENIKSVDKVQGELQENTKNDLVRWDKTTDKFDFVNQEISYMKAIK